MQISAERMSVVVADAGPLIALGRLNRLDLLPFLFSDVQVTATVLDECLARPDLPDAKRITDALSAGLIRRCPDALSTDDGPLDPGESSAIARANEIGAGLLLDDRAAVTHARALGLKVIGTLGVLVLAKRRGKLQEIRSLIEQMRRAGHYLGDAAVLAALHAADET
ncbi:DUF3368 domain-containing protein [Parazoarcus communis]|uniref:DUF3368 domain-containing protein n=1 Tax=Parazoarcus communis TaxID=41977 RepID=UPI00140406AF|nr:DUF3368 domain-containing protein [Parazoarcus communis]NMG70195.1 DUF3368 domain-containing protein [Parazoarcus communis SWub3 = DSM 12120]